MNLLIINFEMDPDSAVLAWQYYVALEIAKLCEHVVILTNRTSLAASPENMDVLPLPRYAIRAPFRWIGGRWLANLVIWRLCRRYKLDACFIHMNMMWSIILAPAFRLLNIPIILWYAHGTVTNKLWRAHQHVTRVVTSTPEGFRIPSEKLSVIGQGIDTSLFQIQARLPNAVDILSVGRISTRKRIHLMVDVMNALIDIDPSVPFRLVVVGPPLTKEDKDYLFNIKEKIAASSVRNRIHLAGHVPVYKIPEYYRSAFLHLNLSQTGSMDKTVMEALAAGCPVLTSNEAFHKLFAQYPNFIITDDQPTAVAQQIITMYRQGNQIDRKSLRNLVVGKHDLATYGYRIMAEFHGLMNNMRDEIPNVGKTGID